MAKRIIKNALNRGTAVYLGGSRVMYVWACGCTKKETLKTPLGVPMHENSVIMLVQWWRRSGVTLPQCKKHPGWYSKESQVARLNAEHPSPQLGNSK